MGLPAPAEREAFHRRRIEVDGYRRSDGLWDIEAHMVDTKTYAFENSWRGEITPGTPLHDMWLRLTLDDSMTVQAVAASTDAHPFRMCPEITPNFQRLVGEQIGAGWTRRVREKLGGVEGCTHLVELLGPIGTIAFQTIKSQRARELQAKKKAARAAPGDKPAEARIPRRPALIDTCHAWSAAGEAVKEHFPAFYTGAPGVPADKA